MPAAAPPGLQRTLHVIYQGLTPLAIECRPSGAGLARRIFRRQSLHDAHRFQADADDLADEADDVLLVGPLGSERMPLRGSSLTWYWSMTQSRALRLPKRYWNVSGGMPASVSESLTFS